MTALAQEAPETPPPEIEVVEPSRPVTELIVDLFDMDPEGWPAELLAAVVEPAAQIVVVLLLAWLLLGLLRRMGRRIIGRAVDDRVDSASQTARVATRRTRRLEALGAILDSVVAVTVWGVAVFTILGTTFGISLAPFLAGAGILGIALGFGAQDLVKDFISGIFMLIEDQYGVGDFVDVGDASGMIESVSLRTTRLRDLEGTVWHVPNGEIRRVGNMSQEWSRTLLDIDVAYSTDVDMASRVIGDVAAALAGDDDYRHLFLADPEVWGVEKLGPDAVSIRLVVKTRPGQQWAIARELRRRIKQAFDDAGIEIPFSQLTVWLRGNERHSGDGGAV